MTEPKDVVAEAIADLAFAVHSQACDMDGRVIGPMDPSSSPVRSLSDAVTAVAWSVEAIAEAIDRLAQAIVTTKEEDEV